MTQLNYIVQEMKTIYLASSPEGDLTLHPVDLGQPFRVGLHETHPSLTLGSYLDTLRDLLTEDGCCPLCEAVGERLHIVLAPEEIHEIIIRTEKHGGFYHIASVELPTGNRTLKLAASTAVSRAAKEILAHEYTLLERLSKAFGLPFLPRPVLCRELPCAGGRGGETLLILLDDWFEDFHEWHLKNPVSGGDRIHLWDRKRGHRVVSGEAIHGLFREIARILTLFYGTKNYHQVLQWHHAAGDFILRETGRGPLQVRLTTVRDYGPLPGLSTEEGVHPMVALVNFFLNMAVRIRIDREEGVGRLLWAGEFALRAVLDGFLGALEEMRSRGGAVPLEGELLSLFRSFSRRELEKLHRPILGILEEEDPMEHGIVCRELDRHLDGLYRIIQGDRG